MISVLYDLYIDIVEYIYKNKISDFPLEINHIFYDPKYSSVEDIEISKDDENLFMDADFYYKGIFSDVDEYLNQMMYICDSDDLNEEDDVGDYNYYSGIINPEVPFLYEMSTHPCHYPNRIIIFGSSYQIEISSDIQSIIIHDLVVRNREAFLSSEKEKMFNWLSETNRPSYLVIKK